MRSSSASSASISSRQPANVFSPAMFSWAIGQSPLNAKTAILEGVAACGNL
jgi:hypothetical protein